MVDEEGTAFFGVEVANVAGGCDYKLVAVAEGVGAGRRLPEKGKYFFVFMTISSFGCKFTNF